MKKVFLVIGVLLSFVLFFPSLAQARIGVGVGSGKIVVESKLKPGEIYKLPSIAVLNTGDEPGEYEVGISYQHEQPQLVPPEKWFSFRPPKFDLKPGDVKLVEVILNLPLKANPGDYFAYVEGRPIIINKDGQAHIGVAAAAKLYFTVIPANVLGAVYYKLRSFWLLYAPWPKRGVMALGVLVFIFVFRKFFRIQVSPNKTKKENE